MVEGAGAGCMLLAACVLLVTTAALMDGAAVAEVTSTRAERCLNMQKHTIMQGAAMQKYTKRIDPMVAPAMIGPAGREGQRYIANA